jgi:pre-mRNA-splicing factor ATP-dependent RNA helicase DHX15/PRP43
VIDSGYQYLSYFNPINGARVLDKVYISKAQAIQRAGRAGRTAPGTCYRLYTKDIFDKMRDYPEANMLVSDITDMCLKILLMPHVRTVDNLMEQLNKFIEVPKKEYIDYALYKLNYLKLVKDGDLTDLGYKTARMEWEVQHNISLIKAFQYNCLTEVATIVAVLEELGNNKIDMLFKTPRLGKNPEINKRLVKDHEEAFKRLRSSTGDHLSILKITVLYEEAEDKEAFAKENFLNKNLLKTALKNRKKIIESTNRVLGERYPKVRLELSTAGRALLAISEGLATNMAVPGPKGTFTTRKANGLRVNESSFCVWKNYRIIYEELFSQAGKKELQMVSMIPRSCVECNGRRIQAANSLY